MVRYFYAWTPVVLVAGIFLLSAPFLGLIALMVVSLFSLVALAALAWAIVAVPYALARALSRVWQEHSAAGPRTAAVLSPARRQAHS